MTGGDQPTATKSGINLRNKYAFIKPISDQYFDLLEFMMTTTGEMRYGASFRGVEIEPPDIVLTSAPKKTGWRNCPSPMKTTCRCR